MLKNNKKLIISKAETKQLLQISDSFFFRQKNHKTNITNNIMTNFDGLCFTQAQWIFLRKNKCCGKSRWIVFYSSAKNALPILGFPKNENKIKSDFFPFYILYILLFLQLCHQKVPSVLVLARVMSPLRGSEDKVNDLNY